MDMLCGSCMANNTVAMDSAAAVDCWMSSQPILALTEANVFAYFGAGIAMSSWVWQKSTVKAWRCFLKRCVLVRISSSLAVNVVGNSLARGCLFSHATCSNERNVKNSTRTVANT